MKQKIILGLMAALAIAAVVYAQEAQVIQRPLVVNVGNITTTRGSVVVGTGSTGGFVQGSASDTVLIEDRTSLTNAQVLALNSTAVTLIDAPATGKFIDVIGGYVSFDYTGAYTVNADDNMRLFWGSRTAGNAASSTIETDGLLTATADTIARYSGVPDDTNPKTATAIAVQGTTTVAFGGGNASNVVTFITFYRVIDDGY